ncbi:CoA binding protein, partial [human gut metagenome]
MTYHFKNPSDGIVKYYLENSKVIAVVGLSDREEATSHRVSKEMQERGYRIIPVN